MPTLAELGEIAKSMPNPTKIKRYGLFNDLFGRKTMANRRTMLKEAEAHHKVTDTDASKEALQGAQKQYNRAAVRRGASLGVGFGAPAVGGYMYANKRNRQYGAAPQQPMMARPM